MCKLLIMFLVVTVLLSTACSSTMPTEETSIFIDEVIPTPSSNGTAPPPKGTWGTYINKTYGYSIKHPSSWEIDNTLSAHVTLTAPGTIAQFVIAPDRDISGFTSASYADLWREMGKEDTLQYSQISDIQVLLDGSIETYEIVETWMRPNLDYQLKGKEVFFTVGNTGYKLYAESKSTEFEAYRDTFDYMIDSFALSGPPPSPEEWLTYTSEPCQYSFEYPASWTVDDLFDDGRLVLVANPAMLARANVKVLPRGDSTLDKRVKDEIVFEWEGSSSYELLANESVKHQGLEVHKTANISQFEKDSLRTQNHSLSLISGDCYYEVSCEVPHLIYGLYSSTFNRIINSFTLADLTEPEMALSVTYVRSPVRAGEPGSVVIKTAPNAYCTIALTHWESGAYTTSGLEDKYADENGIASWAWNIRSTTKPGWMTIEINASAKCQKVSKITGFAVKEAPRKIPTVTTPTVPGVSFAKPATPEIAEWVLVGTMLDHDTVLIVRDNDEVWYLEKGVGCMSLDFYEGEFVLVYSPNYFFAGVGSSIIIPGRKQECWIWYSEFLGWL